MRIVIALLLAAAWLRAADYVVLDAGFPEAAARLAAHHDAPVLALDPEKPEALLEPLQRLAPRHVALVMRPGAIDFAFQRRFLQLATRLDADPFVDFAYGYITGANAEEALALVECGIKAAKEPRRLELRSISGGADRSTVQDSAYSLRGGSFPVRAYRVAGANAFPEEGRDRPFVAEALRGIASAPVVMFIGHGRPAEVVGGPETLDLKALRLDRAVVLNVACYTGVTDGYFERDWRAGRLVRKSVPIADSFCLAVLRAGAAGYTAYLCPRPAGPELDCDLLDLMVRGATLGETRRRDYDKTVLGFLGYGEPRMELAPVAEGAATGRVRDAVREKMLEGATGGVLFGDPALRTFEARPEAHPVQITTERSESVIQVRATCLGNALFLQCNDPTAKLAGKMAHKVVARVPLETDERVRGVAVESVRVGGEPQTAGLVWAIEEDQGERFVQIKVNWPRGGHGDLEAIVRLDTARGGEDAASWGRVPADVEDPDAKPPTPTLAEVAGRHDVSPEAIEAAVAASEAELGRGSMDAVEARAKLAAFGSEGFRAVCCLIEVGRQHKRTVNLLAATYHRGDEPLLIALAGMDLPNYGTWTVLEGLGATGSAKGRRYLLERLEAERAAGNFMAAARGLAHLKERKAVRLVGEQLLRFEEGWNGVAGALIRVLRDIGHRSASRYLESYCLDERATHAAQAQAVLRALDPRAAERVDRKRGRG